MILTLIPIRAFYQTSGGVVFWETAVCACVGPPHSPPCEQAGKNKMSETVRAVGRESTTIIVSYIGFRPSWSSNVELILRSNQVVGEMKDIIYKCYRYRADSDTVRFPAGRQCVIKSMSKPAGPDASKHGLYVRMESKRSK